MFENIKFIYSGWFYVMLELTISQKGIMMSVVSSSLPDTGKDLNLKSAQSALTSQLNKIAPVCKFYEEMATGWKKRYVLANSALHQMPSEETRNRKILEDLVELSAKGYTQSQGCFNEVDAVRQNLENKIQDLDLFILKSNSSNGVNTLEENAFDLREIQKVLYTSDALLELKASEKKEIGS